jgi:hypothetical protein
MTKCTGKRTFRHLVLACLAMAAGSLTAPSAGAQETQPVSPNLTPKLQDLLRTEMRAVEDASREILSALIAGNDARVAELAQNIHDSFILKQEMTPKDKQALMAAVPDDFLAQDRAFHQLSAGLAQAARDGDRDSQLAEFGRMIEACTACHARYATDRFPMLAE